MRKLLFGTALAALVATTLLAPNQAQAWWHGGFYWGGPAVVIAPPVVVAPPVYAAPPVVYAPPPAYQPPPAGSSCYAGPYICPLDHVQPAGSSCTCPTNTTRVFGQVR